MKYEKSTLTKAKFWICDSGYVDGDLKVWDHCHITRKYRGSTYRGYDTQINQILNSLLYSTTYKPMANTLLQKLLKLIMSFEINLKSKWASVIS